MGGVTAPSTPSAKFLRTASARMFTPPFSFLLFDASTDWSPGFPRPRRRPLHGRRRGDRQSVKSGLDGMIHSVADWTVSGDAWSQPGRFVALQPSPALLATNRERTTFFHRFLRTWIAFDRLEGTGQPPIPCSFQDASRSRYKRRLPMVIAARCSVRVMEST